MIPNNVRKVFSDIEEICRQLGRDPKNIVVVAVTKTMAMELIQEAINAGISHIAENRVQEAENKFPLLLAQNPHIKSHIIGHLQTNKAKDAIKVCSMIQSVDSLKLAQEIEKQAAKKDQDVEVLVQFNTAQEEQKFGAAPEDANVLIESISQLSHVKIKGLMCMAPYTEDQGIIRKTFVDLRGIRDAVKIRFSGHANVDMGILSMGMSSDYKIAIEEGSTMVRVGSAILKRDKMKKNIIGIIGGGNMGEALIKGLHKSHSIYVHEINSNRAEYLKKEYNVDVSGISEVIKNAQVIILAVKPQDMQAAFSWIRADDLREDKLFISIAAGLTTEYFENCIKNIVMQPNPRVVRAMPNMPALINEGITGVCKGQHVTDEDLKTAEVVLGALGETLRVTENMMDAITAVSGSGPAYVFLFVEQWINAAVKLGFDQSQAKQLVYKTLLGSAHLLEQSPFDASELRVKVTSKGGTTQAAMDVFSKGNIEQLMNDALIAAKKRSEELAK